MEFPAFRVDRRSTETAQVLAPSGRITLGQSVRELRQAFDQLAEDGHLRVILNMENVPYLDSAGLGTIVTGLNLFKKAGGTLILSNVQPRVAQLLELTKLTGVLPAFPTEASALENLS